MKAVQLLEDRGETKARSWIIQTTTDNQEYWGAFAEFIRLFKINMDIKYGPMNDKPSSEFMIGKWKYEQMNWPETQKGIKYTYPYSLYQWYFLDRTENTQNRQDSLIKQIKKYKLIDKITFLGNISNTIKMKYMVSSKLFVLPTFYEGFGISLVEASALGLNVITSDLPVLREVLKGCQVCFIPINDIEKLSNAIESCLLEQSKINKSYPKYYNWQNTAKIMKRALYVS